MRSLRFGLLILAVLALLALTGLRYSHNARADGGGTSSGSIFATSTRDPQLQLPEGLTSWDDIIYVGDFDVFNPTASRILVYSSYGKLLRVIGGTPSTQLVSAGPLLGLAIDRSTGDLYANANGIGQVLRIQNPSGTNPKVSVCATLPAVGSTPAGPEDMAFAGDGTLYVSDSNTQRLYSIPPGCGQARLIEGPAGSGAPLIDNGDLFSPVNQGSPNGLVFSKDFSTLYACNLGADSVVAFTVRSDGSLTNERIFAQHKNDDLEEYPTGDEILIQPDTHFGASATTPLNGADGLALDSQGNLWVASALGDNLTELNGSNGAVIKMVGTSAVTQGGLLNNPSSVTFLDNNIYTTNLNFFEPSLPWTVATFNVGVSGAGGNGNY